MATSEEIFEFKTAGLAEVLSAYRQIEQAQKSIEDVSKQVATSLERQATAQQQLVRSSRELTSANTATVSSLRSIRSELSNQLAAEKQLAQQIKATNAAYSSRRVPTIAGGGDSFSETIGASLEDSITQSIEQGFKNAQQGNILGAIGNVLTAPFAAIGSIASGALSSVGFGLVQAITAPIGANFGKGLSNALESSLSRSVGSSELFAEKVGGAIGASITAGVSSRLQGLPDLLEAQIARIDDKELRKKLQDVLAQVREAPGQIRASVTDTIGQDEILREGLFQRGQQQQARDARTPTIREQSVQEWRSAIEQLSRVETAATQRLSALEQQIQERQSEFNQAQQRYQQINQRLEQAQQSGQSTQAIAEIAEDLRFAGEDLQNLSQTIAALSQARQVASRAVEEARQNSVAARGRVEQVLPQRQPQAFTDLAQATLGNVDPERLPRLVVDDALLRQQNAASLYQLALNAIVTTSEIFEAIQNNSLTEKQSRVLSEELAHAQDFDFGSARGIDAARQNRVVMGRQIEATPEELSRLAPEVGRYSAERRNVELNAKVQADRGTERFLQQRQQQESLQQVSDLAAAQDIAPVKQQFLNAIKLLQRVAAEQGADLSETIAQYIQIYEQQFAKVKAVSEKAASQAGTATAQDIAELQAEMQAATNAVRTVITAVINRIEKLRNPEPEPLQIPFNPPKQRDRELVEVEPRQQTEPIARRQEQPPTIRERVSSAAEGAGQAARTVVDGAQKTASAIRQVGEKLQTPAAALVQGVGTAAKATAAIARTGYKVAEGLESLALDIVPAGRAIKSVTKNVALPAAAFGTAAALLPGGSAAVGAATQLASSALVPLGNAATSGAASAIAGTVPNVLGLQTALTGSVTAGIDLAIAGAAGVIAKTGVAVVGGRTVSALANRAANVVGQAIGSAVDSATEKLDAAKVARQTQQARSKEQGAIEVSASEISQRDQFPAAKVEPKATQQQINDAVAQAKNLDKQFASAYQRLKDAIKSGDARLVQAYEETIRELAVNAKRDIDALTAQLKAAGDTSGAIGTLGGVKGRLTRKENLVNKELAKFQKEQQARGADLNAQALNLSVGFGGLDDGLAALKNAAARTANALNRAIASFAEIEQQANLTDTVKAAAQSPKVQGVAKDVAVNTAGFAASQLAGQAGTVADLGADLIAALVARQGVNAGIAATEAYQDLKDDPNFQSANQLEKAAMLLQEAAKRFRSESDEVFGDLAGFAVGNAVRYGGDALGVPVPGKGAMAAMAAVPQLQALRERINTATRTPDIARGEDLEAQSLNPKQAIRAINSRRKALLEVLEQQIGNFMDELTLRMQGQPDLIDNAKVTRTIALLNKRVERLMDERSQRIDELDEQQFQKLLASQRATLARLQARQAKQPNVDNLIDDLTQKEQQETLRQAQKTTQDLQRRVYEAARKGLVDDEAQLPLLRVEDPAEGDSLVKQLKLFYGRLTADIQENARKRLNTLLTESQSLGNDLATSATVFQGRGDTDQAQRLGQVQQRLTTAQTEAQQILIKPRVEVTDQDLKRLKDLEREIRDVYKAVNLPPPKDGGFLGDIGEDAALSGGRFAGVGAAIVGLGAGQVASQALGSAARQATQTFQEFASFDQQIRTFGVVSQASQEQVSKLRAEVEELAGSTVFGNSAIASASIELAKQGFNAEQATRALKGVTLSASASGESLTDTAKVIGTALNQFQLDASQSATVADLLTQASNASATGTAQIGESLKYVGGQSKDANQTVQETITVLALMAASGLDASSAGTGLAEALKRIRTASASATTELTDLRSRGSKQAIAAFNLLNQEVRDSNGNLLPFTQVLARVKQGLQNFPKQEQELILNALFGVQGSRAVLSVIGLTDEKVNQISGSMQKFQGSSEKAATALTQGPQGAIEKFNGALEKLRIRAGETAAIAFVPLLNAANGVFDAFDKLPAPVQQTVIAVGGLGTAIAAGTLAIAAFQVANASFIGTIVRSAAVLALDTGAIVARTVATKGATIAQVLFNTQVTAGTAKTAALVVVNKAGAISTAAFGAATSGSAAAMGLASAAATKLGASLLTVVAPLAVLGAGVALTGLVKLTEQIGDVNNALEEQRAASDATVGGTMNSLGRLVNAQKAVNAARQQGKALSADEKKSAQDAIKQGNQSLNILKQQLAQAEKIPQAQAGLFGVGKEEAEAQNRARQTNINGIKNQIAAIERNRDSLQKSLATDNAKTLAANQQTKANKNLVDSIKDRLDLGELTKEEALAQLEAIQNNTKLEVNERNKAKAAIDKIRAEDAKDEKTAREEQLKSRQASIDSEIAAIQAGQAQIEAQQAAGNLSEAEADKRLTDLKIQEIQKRIDAALAAQELGSEEERNKAIQEESKLQAEIAKVQAEFRKREKERRLQDILEAAQDAEAAIKQSQNTRIIAEREAELAALQQTGADREQVERTTQQRLAQIQLQGTNDEVAAKQQALTQIRQARAAGTIDAEKAADEEKRLISEIGQLTLQRIDAEKAQLEALRQEKLRQIELDLKRANNPLDLQSQRLQLENTLLTQQNNLITARQSLEQALVNLEQQRLQFALEDAKASGNTAAANQIQEQIFASQTAWLERQSQLKLQQLDLTERQKTNELRMAELAERRAINEAKANIAKAVAEGKNQEEIGFLKEALALREESLGVIREQQADQAKLNQLNRDTIAAENQAAKEKLQRDQKQARDEQKKQAGQSASGGVGGVGGASGGQQQGTTKRSFNLSGDDIGRYDQATKAFSQILANNQTQQDQQIALLKELTSGTLNDREKDFLAQRASDLGFSGATEISGLAKQLEGLSQFDLEATIRQTQEAGGDIIEALKGLAENAKSASGKLGGLPNLQARRDGGHIQAGRPYLVGEEGAELITPTRSGYVHTATQTQGMLANFVPRDIAASHRLPVTPTGDKSLLKEIKSLNQRIDDLVSKAAYPRTLILQGQTNPVSAAKTWSELSKRKVQQSGF